MKQIVILITLIVFSSFAFGLFDRKITTTQHIIAGPYCKQNGNCSLDELTANKATIINLTYANVTVVEYNVTGQLNVDGNMSVEGNITASNFFGFLNFSWIQNWNFSYIYDEIKSFISNDFYNKTKIDNLLLTIDTNETERFNNLVSTNCTGDTPDMIGVYNNGTAICGIDDNTGSGSGTSNDTVMVVYLSSNHDVSYTNLFYQKNGIYKIVVTPYGEIRANQWGEIA